MSPTRVSLLSGWPSWSGALERGYCYFGIIYYQQGLIAALQGANGIEQAKSGEVDIFKSSSQFLILVIVIAIWIRRSSSFIPLLRHLMPYIVILLLSFASVLWSDNPGLTVRRDVAQLTCVMFSAYLYQSCGLGRIILMFGRAAIVLGILSLILFFVAPSIAHDVDLGYGNAMRGVFPQKNVMGECMLVALSCFAYQLVAEQGRRTVNLACIAISFVCLVLGRSATSVVIAGVVLTTAALMGLRNRPKVLLLARFIVAWAGIMLIVLVILTPETLLDLAGRDASLTGRVPLWNLVLAKIGERPLLGHGYAGFWDANSVSVQYLWLQNGWEAPHSHNGYLEVLLQLGVVGLLCYAWLWFSTIIRAVRAARHGNMAISRWLLLFMLLQGLENLDEGPLSSPDHFMMLTVAASMTFSVWSKNDRLRRRLAWSSEMSIPFVRNGETRTATVSMPWSSVKALTGDKAAPVVRR